MLGTRSQPESRGRGRGELGLALISLLPRGKVSSLACTVSWQYAGERRAKETSVLARGTRSPSLRRGRRASDCRPGRELGRLRVSMRSVGQPREAATRGTCSRM